MQLANPTLSSVETSNYVLRLGSDRTNTAVHAVGHAVTVGDIVTVALCRGLPSNTVSAIHSLTLYYTTSSHGVYSNYTFRRV